MDKPTNSKGMSLPIVLIVMAIMIILGFTTLNITTNQSKFNLINNASQKSTQYAEAGYNKYLWHMNDDLNFYSSERHEEITNRPIEFEDGYFILDVTKPSDSDRFITIKSTGWTKKNPDIKKTILAKIRKKQFVHHVYVSNNDGDIWWTKDDESHGPYHTNGNMNIQQTPKFYDIVTYNGKLETSNAGVGYKPEFFIDKEFPYKPRSTDENLSYLYQATRLEFPKNNQKLEEWAIKDNMVFYGRTCIFLEGDKIKIRNQNDDTTITYSISEDIPNKVIYVNTKYLSESDKENKVTYDKFNINSGNVFISGELEGKLTIGAEDRIYITHDDPTNWYDYGVYDKNKKPKGPSLTAPNSGGIVYKNTYFNGNKNGTGSELSIYDSDKKIWTRYSFDNNDKTKPGKDMLGLIANNEILVLHYGWPKQIDSYGDSWNFRWGNWVEQYEFKRQYLNNGTYYNYTIEGYNNNKPYDVLKVGTNRRGQNNKYDLPPGYYNVLQENKEWGWTKGAKETYDVAPKNITIHAAIFSVNQGFGYEDSSVGGSKGNIYLWGNITQRTRKAVGTTGGVGYKKKYAHDPRMFYDYPPHILEPTNVGWEIHEWKEINDHLIENHR